MFWMEVKQQCAIRTPRTRRFNRQVTALERIPQIGFWSESWIVAWYDGTKVKTKSRVKSFELVVTALLGQQDKASRYQVILYLVQA